MTEIEMIRQKARRMTRRQIRDELVRINHGYQVASNRAGRERYARRAEILQTELKTRAGRREPRRCRRCGCTYFDPCVDSAGITCHWVEKDLCSHCLTPAERRRVEAGDKNPSRGKP